VYILVVLVSTLAFSGPSTARSRTRRRRGTSTTRPTILRMGARIIRGHGRVCRRTSTPFVRSTHPRIVAAGAGPSAVVRQGA